MPTERTLTLRSANLNNNINNGFELDNSKTKILKLRVEAVTTHRVRSQNQRIWDKKKNKMFILQNFTII